MSVVPGRLVSLAALLLLMGAAALLCAYYRRYARIAAFARAVTRDTPGPREAVFALARELYLRVRRGPNPKFFSPLLAPLGASPVAVLEQGGCCSGIHRLFITALDAIGIRAAQITVYNNVPGAAHCLAQVSVDGASLIVDVDYGVWYRQANGDPVSLGQLRSGVVPLFERFVLDAGAVRIEGRFRTPPGYPERAYFAFDYRRTRTANWTMSRLRRLAYAVLRPLTRGRVDCLLLPPVLEWPELVLALILCVTAGALLTAQRLLGLI